MYTIKSKYVGFSYPEDSKLNKDEHIHFEKIALKELMDNLEYYRDGYTDEICITELAEYLMWEHDLDDDDSSDIAFVIEQYYEKQKNNKDISLFTKGGYNE